MKHTHRVVRLAARSFLGDEGSNDPSTTVALQGAGFYQKLAEIPAADPSERPTVQYNDEIEGLFLLRYSDAQEPFRLVKVDGGKETLIDSGIVYDIEYTEEVGAGIKVYANGNKGIVAYCFVCDNNVHKSQRVIRESLASGLQPSMWGQGRHH